MKSVLVSIPNQGWIHKLVMQAAIRIMQDPRYRVAVITPTWRPYEHNMNRIAKDFLASDYDYWLSIDADNPPTQNPLDSVEAEFDVVGYPTPVWRDDAEGIPLYWNAMMDAGDGYKPARLEKVSGIIECDAVGSGCIRFNREVISEVRHMFGAPFIRTIDEDGCVEYGPDFEFCRRAKSLGFTVGVDTDRPCRHFSETDLMTAAQRFGEIQHGR